MDLEPEVLKELDRQYTEASKILNNEREMLDDLGTLVEIIASLMLATKQQKQFAGIEDIVGSIMRKHFRRFDEAVLIEGQLAGIMMPISLNYLAHKAGFPAKNN